jgi:hypothetical protein
LNLKSLLVQFWIGFGLVGVASIMVLAGGILRDTTPMIAALGPFIAGAVNMAVAQVLRRKLAQNPRPAADVTPEAKKMLTALSFRFVWSKNPWMWGQQQWWDPSAMGQPDGDATWNSWNPQGSWINYYNTRLDALPEIVWASMENAAFNYNRLVGAIEASGSSSSIQRLAPRITQGADEAILDVMHQAQLISKFPEGAGSIQAQLETRVATLKELGDRVEALVLREPTFTERLAQRTTADEVLDELRLEQAAYHELSSKVDQDQLRQNLGG